MQFAPMLVADYRPRALVYAVSAWDVRDTERFDGAEGIDWLRYRNGTTTVRGWLSEHSAAYRYYLTVRYRLRFSADLVPLLHQLEREIDGDGFLPRQAVFQGTPYGPYDAAPPPSAALEELGDGVRRLARLAAERGARFVVIEVPTPQTAAHRPAGGTRLVLDELAAIASREALGFRGVSPGEVSPEGFADVSHLNSAGAAAFSERVGVWLGAMLRETAPSERAAVDALGI